MVKVTGEAHAHVAMRLDENPGTKEYWE